MATKAYQVFFKGIAVDDNFYGDVVSLTVEEANSTPSTFRLQLISRIKDDGSWGYLDDDRLALYTKISVKVGFMAAGGIAGALESLFGLRDGDDNFSTVFDGYITAVDFAIGGSNASTFVEVSGADTSVLMSLEEKITSWANLADSNIVRQIVEGYHVELNTDPTPTVHHDPDTTILQRGTDLQFVQELARRNGLEFYFETDDQTNKVVAFFRTPQLQGTPQPGLAIRFADESNLRSFSAHLSGQRPLNVKTQQMDVKSNSLHRAQIGALSLTKLGDKDANDLIGGPIHSLVSAQDAPAQMLVLGSPTSDLTELATLAQAVRNEAGWFITAEGEVNTDAYQFVLRPRRLVLIKGAGRHFSGKYYVTRVRHEIRVDGSYKQKFEARRNARDVNGSGGLSGLSTPGDCQP